jgi:sigma-B regulation protein RsbU (phosphoserine phosphatase)
MADVSDKSVHAALFMAITRTLFLAHARRSVSPTEVALAVHHGIMEVSTTDEMFVTVFYGVLRIPTGQLCYVRAGQDKPLLFRGESGLPQLLEAEGRFLGMLPDLSLEERCVELRPNDMLVAYSDGIPDAVNEQDDAYGTARLINLIAQHRSAPAAEVCSAIFNDVFAFRGEAPAFDDITVLVAQCEDNR